MICACSIPKNSISCLFYSDILKFECLEFRLPKMGTEQNSCIGLPCCGHFFLLKRKHKICENVRGSFFRFGKTRNMGELKKILGPFQYCGYWKRQMWSVLVGGGGDLNHEPDTIVGQTKYSYCQYDVTGQWQHSCVVLSFSLFPSYTSIVSLVLNLILLFIIDDRTGGLKKCIP